MRSRGVRKRPRGSERKFESRNTTPSPISRILLSSMWQKLCLMPAVCGRGSQCAARDEKSDAKTGNVRGHVHPGRMVARRAEPVAEFQERHLNVSRMLVDHGVPISVVAELVNDRALLALDPARLEEQFGILCDVWPNRTSLIRTIHQYPFVLSDESWLARLPRSTTDLTDMGWSGAEAAKMIIERPDIVYVRRFELHNTMKAIKRILGTDDQANFMQFFAKNPAALLEWQTRFLPRVEQLVELTGMASEEVIRFVVQHDAAFKLDIGAMKITMGVIHEFCGADGGEMAREIVRSQPQMLTMTTTRVDDSLRVLRILGISPEEIARYVHVLKSIHQLLGLEHDTRPLRIAHECTSFLHLNSIAGTQRLS